MENITCSPWEHCCGEGLTASCCSVTEVGFQQGLFFMRVSQHAKSIGGVNCEKYVSDCALGASNFDIFDD